MSRVAQDALVDLFGKLLKKIVTRTCRSYHLHDQEREEVLAETYQQLLNPEIARFAPHRGKPQHYFQRLVQNAARKVLTQRDARRRKGVPPNDSGAAVGEGSEEFVGGGQYRSIRSLPSPAEDAECRDLVRFILEAASPRVRRALQLCYWDQWPLLSIAAHLGVSRFALAREIQAFFQEIIVQFGDG